MVAFITYKSAAPPVDDHSLCGQFSSSSLSYVGNLSRNSLVRAHMRVNFSTEPATGYVSPNSETVTHSYNSLIDSKYLDAWWDLQHAMEDAQEEGFPIPSSKQMVIASYLLRQMHVERPQRFEVYPMPNGEIAIDAPNGRGSSLIVLCEPSGEVLCSVNIRGSHRQKRYLSAEGLPDSFLQNALSEVAQAR
jgi:hypothetical protein